MEFAKTRWSRFHESNRVKKYRRKITFPVYFPTIWVCSFSASPLPFSRLGYILHQPCELLLLVESDKELVGSCVIRIAAIAWERGNDVTWLALFIETHNTSKNRMLKVYYAARNFRYSPFCSAYFLSSPLAFIFFVVSHVEFQRLMHWIDQAKVVGEVTEAYKENFTFIL